MLRVMATSSVTSQIDEIKTTLATLLEADRKDEALEMFVTVLSQLATDHDRLQHQLRLLLKNRFGRKTEKIDPAQLRLFLEELRQAAEKDNAPAPDATRPVVAHVRRKPIAPRGKRPALPDSLPRQVVRLEPAATERTCSCGTAKTCIGCETSQVLELVPAQFKGKRPADRTLAWSNGEDMIAFIVGGDHEARKRLVDGAGAALDSGGSACGAR